MKRSIQLLLSLLLLVALVPLASAQATRTWVSGVGDDANPCSRTAPCKTFAGAISKTAPGGEIDALDPGGFGAVTITKGMTIDGGGGQVASVLVSGTNGIVVQANSSTDTVILRNLRINGISAGLNGINFTSGKQLIVENCEIFGFTQNGINVSLNQAGGANVVVHNTNISNNAGTGVAFFSANGTLLGSLSNVGIREGANGVSTDASGHAPLVDISNSTVTEFSGIGLHTIQGTISSVGNMLTNNLTAVQAENGTTVRLSNNDIYNNTFGIKIVGTATIASATNNRTAGNFSPGAPTTTIPIQ